MARYAIVIICGWVLAFALIGSARAEISAPADQARTLFTQRCVKCHGPLRPKGALNLSNFRGIARGGKKGAVVVAGHADQSPIWEQISADKMPPEHPLPADEKDLIRRWIDAGAPGLPSGDLGPVIGADHWAFQFLRKPPVPSVPSESSAGNEIDRFIQAKLFTSGLSPDPRADRTTLIRRVCYDLTGLPPALSEVDAFVSDASADAYERMVERYLASPRYGERWGQYWLDAAGYADSSGYFSSERPRPLAYRYRDYVIDSFNRDVPFDQFVREQLAGDELVDYRPDQLASADVMRCLVATQYLSNAPDGTDQSAPSPEAMRVDRYAALEGTQQVIASSLLGLSLKCARCHDHKFEPISQREYYSVQSILLPALNPTDWVPPLKRTTSVLLPDDVARWEAKVREHQARLAGLRDQHRRMDQSMLARRQLLGIDAASAAPQHLQNRVTLFKDDQRPLAAQWALAAPAGADAAARAEPVVLDADAPGRHSAVRQGSAIRIIARKHCESMLATQKTFDWTPDQVGQSIQATFDLVDDHTESGGIATQATKYFGYLIAARDSLRKEKDTPGNLLLDGNTLGNPSVYFNYPGKTARKTPLGTIAYHVAHNYGVRITNAGGGRFELLHLIDGLPDGEPLTLAASELPDGRFAFYFGSERSFVVDRVMVQTGTATNELTPAQELVIDERRQTLLAKQIKDMIEFPPAKEGTTVTWTTDRSQMAPKAHVLKRGTYGNVGEEVQPAGLAVLSDADNPFTIPAPPAPTSAPSPPLHSTYRRLALANWLTKPGSRPAALLARVQADRIWRHHFGRGLVPTADNFGLSGSPPTHPELLEYLASRLIESGWRVKDLHRLILCSATYRQSSLARPRELEVDGKNALYWRFPLRRLEAEAIRDSLLAVSGELDLNGGGPIVPIDKSGSEQEQARGALGREIVINEKTPGARRRSIYLQHWRSQLPTVLALFDTPIIGVNCVERQPATIPLQSLAQLNSDFTRLRASKTAERLQREAGEDNVASQVRLAYRLAIGRMPSTEELSDAQQFLAEQSASYAIEEFPSRAALADFCQMLLSSNAFLYIE